MFSFNSFKENVQRIQTFSSETEQDARFLKNASRYSGIQVQAASPAVGGRHPYIEYFEDIAKASLRAKC